MVGESFIVSVGRTRSALLLALMILWVEAEGLGKTYR